MALKALYRLENIYDSSGEGHTLTNNGGVLFTPARFNRGANLGTPNSTKTLTISDNLDIDGGAITINIWVKLLAEIEANLWCFTSHSSATTMVNEQISYEYNGGTRRIAVARTKQNVADNKVYKTVTLGTSDFHMITITYDGTDIIGYHNAVSFGTIGATGNGNKNPLNIFTIGAYPTGGTSQIASTLNDETSVYNTALGQADITALYDKKISTAGFFFFMCEAYQKGKKYFKKKGLFLPDDRLFKPKLVY